MDLPGKEKYRFCSWNEGWWGQEQEGSGGRRERERKFRERWLELGSISGVMWKQCNGNYLESARVSLMRTPSNGEYGI